MKFIKSKQTFFIVLFLVVVLPFLTVYLFNIGNQEITWGSYFTKVLVTIFITGFLFLIIAGFSILYSGITVEDTEDSLVELGVISKNNILPSYATKGSSGLDVTFSEVLMHFSRENTKITPKSNGEIKLYPGERALLSTGLKLAIPEGFEVQVRPRSGNALKMGITVLNSPGTLDHDYIGDVGVILINHSGVDVYLRPGDLIAQLVLTRVEKAELKVINSLSKTERGTGGFGSTGLNRK